MKEIKFRAWDGENMLHPVNVWEFGVDDVYGDCWEGKVVDKEKITLMQYTGLKDKNGVEIYEGDIVTTDYPTVKNMADNWLVEYGHTGMFQMAVGSFKQSIHELVYNDWKLEVIGNKFENPELLESK